MGLYYFHLKSLESGENSEDSSIGMDIIDINAINVYSEPVQTGQSSIFDVI